MDTGNMSPQSAAICWIFLKWQTPGVLGKECSTVKHGSQKLHLRSYSMFSFSASENREIRACLGSGQPLWKFPRPAKHLPSRSQQAALSQDSSTSYRCYGGGWGTAELNTWSQRCSQILSGIPSPALLEGNLWLTTLVVLGDAPWCISCDTIFTCPMKAATWIGVRPDWKTDQSPI